MTLKRPRILVVDDELDSLNTISTILKEEGYRVDTAQTGNEAINKCMEEIYSLLLIDIKLPDFDGTQLLKRIADTDPKIRKVIFTGYPTLENAQEALNLGADAYLIKPVNTELLLQVVSQQLTERDNEFQKRYSSLQRS